MDYFNVVDALETSTKAIKIENINADDTKTLVDDSVSAHANIFPRLPQVHPMKRKNRTEKKCQKQLQEVQPESEQKHLMRKSKRKCRQKSIADLS